MGVDLKSRRYNSVHKKNEVCDIANYNTGFLKNLHTNKAIILANELVLEQSKT